MAHRQAARFRSLPSGSAASAPAATSCPPASGRRISLFSISRSTIDFLVKALLRQPARPAENAAGQAAPQPGPALGRDGVAAATAPERPEAGPPTGRTRASARQRPGLSRRHRIGAAGRPRAHGDLHPARPTALRERRRFGPLLLASYDGARVSVPFRTSKRHIAGRTEDWVLEEYQIKELTSRWGKLFATHRTIKRFVDSPDGTPPPEAVLLEFGALLFETLLPGDVKRLFDVARSREQEKLLIIFTSTIPVGVRHAMGVRPRSDARHLPGDRGCPVRAQHLHDHPGRSLAAEDRARCAC